MRWILALLLLSLLVSCRRKSAAVDETGLPPKLTAPALLAQINKQLYNPPFAELKGDARITGGSMGNVNVSATVRLQRDSVFWFSLRKFGFEGARGKVTTDSVIALNRLQRQQLTASAADLPAAARVLPIGPTVANLTAAFAGQPIGDWSQATITRQPGHYSLTSDQYPGTTLTVDARRMVPTSWRYQNDKRYGQVNFNDFRPAGDQQVFPYARTLVFSDSPGDTTRVLLEFSSLSTDGSLTFPISVPPDYAPMEF